ncbi:MAG: hypothetical protein ACTHLL_07205 [Candidatus Nitrosocosmicus sp.]
MLSSVTLTNQYFTYAALKGGGSNSNTTASSPLGYLPPLQITTSIATGDQKYNNNDNNTSLIANTITSGIGQSQLN